VLRISIGGIGALFGGLSPPKPLCGDGIEPTSTAFFFLRCFKFAHICIEVTSLRKGGNK